MQKLWISFIIFFVIGCQEPLKIGSKPFSEQLILGEVIAQLAEHEGVAVKRMIPYGETRDCIQGLTSGQLDVYVEYTGTGLMILGQPSLHDKEKAFTIVQKQFAEIDVHWQKRLGFANNYVLVIRRSQAVSDGIENIANLANLSSLRISCDLDFTKRPLDGLAAMLRRYGLKTDNVIIEDDKSAMYRALLNGEVDVAIGYSTDGQIDAFDFKVVEDNLHFFPVYEAVPVVNKSALTKYPKLQSTLEKLENLIDEKTMRSMNRQVELEGVHYRDVARQFLRENKLIPNDKKGAKNKYKNLVFAVENLDELSGAAGKAQQVIHKVFRGRHLKLERCASPRKALIDGKARIALMGAESFFDINKVVQNRKKGIEAVAAVGYKMCHVVMRKDHSFQSFSDIKSIATDEKGTGSYTMAQVLLKAFQLEDKVKITTGELDESFQKLQQKEIDCVVLLLPQKHARLTKLLEKDLYKLFSLDEWKKLNFQFRFPFLRLSRIPKDTYLGQNIPIETLSSQIVLAGPAKKKEFLGDAGPATAIYNKAQPLSNLSILTLNKQLQNEELDPILPVAKILQSQTKKRVTSISSYESSLANMLVIIAIIYLIFLFLKEESIDEANEAS
ncbi:glycine betaine ABC transporter substrate-binding protein [Candidatus Uabimicrobium sp. HlEnr_7]|uniref:glycine betaine ABC transporter substrate-binding protein n=1 Tax=Candidatus Uabimicrobium helgolandensis TaxID=3095367 RepID=UPI00355692E0